MWFNHSLPNFMELSPSLEAANFAATQKLSSILWNLKVHYRVHKIPPLFSKVSKIEPVQDTTSIFSKIHFSIVHLRTRHS
jgi:hypothetical protein